MADSVAVDISVADTDAFDEAIRQALADELVPRIQRQDASLWGPEAEAEAAIRLGWVRLADSSRELVGPITALRDELRDAGLDHIVLCGMGGSSLAPEVICRAAGVELTVLDSSQPDMVREVIRDRLDTTVVVISSKSGGTVETDSQRRVYEQAFADAGIDRAERIVVVTDPASPLESEARAAGYRVFTADPEVGGRYSALTAFGLVPTGLAGVDLNALLDDAAAATPQLFENSADNPALRLGVAMGIAHRASVNKLVLADSTGDASVSWGIGDWIEQLVAESTGKLQRGLLPVVVAEPSSPNFTDSTPDSVLVHVGTQQVPDAASGFGVAISGSLAAIMLAAEIATAVCGHLIGINPFDQPDVESAKAAARELLTGSVASAEPDSADGAIEIYGSSTGSVTAVIDELFESIDREQGYFAIQAYLDRFAHQDFGAVRDTAARRSGRPVTFGWAPRFLHSTGQYHKGGPPNGVFLQVTCDPLEDLAIAGRDFTLGELCASQADGDAAVLRQHGRPVVRLHLTDIAALSLITEALT